MKSPDCQNVPLWLPEKVWVVYFEAVKGKKSEISQTIRYQGSNAVFGIVLKNIPPTMCCYISGAFTIQDGRSRHIFDFFSKRNTACEVTRLVRDVPLEVLK
jgi:hypothetical protein